MSDEREVNFQLNLRLYRRFLWGVCYELAGSPEDADDLLSEVVLILHARYHGYDMERPFEPWARAVIHRYYQQRRRRQARDARRQTTLDTIAETAPETAPPYTDADYLEH